MKEYRPVRDHGSNQPAASQRGSELRDSGPLRYFTDFSDLARRRRSADFKRTQNSSKLELDPCHRRSSTVSNTGTSSRKVASVRNNRASFHALNNDSESGRALRIEGSHSRQFFGMSSRCGYWDKVSAAAFAPQPGKPGKPSALSPTTAK